MKKKQSGSKQRPLKLPGKTCFLDPKIQDHRFKTLVDQIQTEGGVIVSDISPALSYLVLDPSRKKSGRSQPEREVKKLVAAGASIQVVDTEELTALVLPAPQEAVALLRGSASEKERLAKVQPRWESEGCLTIADVDLRGVDLAGYSFPSIRLLDVDLRGANLEGAHIGVLERVRVEGANVRGLKAAKISHCSFDGLSLGAAQLGEIEDSSFRGCDLSELPKGGFTWRRCDFSGANLFLFRPSPKHIQDPVLHQAQLSQCDLMHCELPRVNLSGANLTFADLEFCSFTEASLSKVTATQAQFDEANLQNADLRGADLRYANLSNTDLRGAKVTGADFTGVNLNGAKIDKLPLKSARGLAAAAKGFEAGPRLKALLTLCRKHSSVSTEAIVEGKEGWRAWLQLTISQKGKQFETRERSRTTTNKLGGRRRVDLKTLPEAVNDLLCKFRCGELALDSITIQHGGNSSQDSKRIAIDAWCEAFGRPIPTSEELEQAGEQAQQQLLARQRIWAERLRTDPSAVREWSSLDELERAGIAFDGWDFANANLARINLKELSCMGASFRGANLEDANLAACSMQKALFQRASLVKGWLSRADCSEANFSEANLSEATAKKTTFRGASLRGACLRGACLLDADLRSADLSGAELSGAELRDARFDEQTKLPKGFPEISEMKWMGKGPAPKVKGKKMPRAKLEQIDFNELMIRLRKGTDSGRMARSVKMLKAERFQLFADVDDDSLTGVVRSQTSKDLVYACQLSSTGSYTCCTQNLNACGGLAGRPCKHLLVLIMGLTRKGMLDCGKADLWLREAAGKSPALDRELLSHVFLKYKGAEAGEIDWRPTETIPEDFYAL